MSSNLVSSYVSPVELDEGDILLSLKEAVARIGFNNNVMEPVYVVTAKIHDDSVVVEMTDGTKFELSVKKV